MKTKQKSVSLDSGLVKRINEIRKAEKPPDSFSKVLCRLAWVGVNSIDCLKEELKKGKKS